MCTSAVGDETMKSRSGWFGNKVAIITGASSGIGRALAINLSKNKAFLVLAARNEAELNKVAHQCEGNGARALAIPMDVANQQSCSRLIERAVAEFKQIDMLINNAGIDVLAKFEDLPDMNLFKRVIDVNFYGAVYCTYSALPYLKNSCGRIVNVSSMAGVVAVPLNTSYVASKFAMNGFSDSLRMELLHTGVAVTVICPYWVVSRFHENYMDKNGTPKGEAGRAVYTERTMSSERCAEIIIEAARCRKREVMLGPGRISALLRLIAPRTTESIIINRVLKPISERARAAEGRKGA
jgi:short-subunit dehydrogenase